ncbi:hypothetical protein OE09_0312 [Flavobacteriaceae bacterium MAR_2010_72]|nr:hypothetical protein OE09_0312 [Flavobacteriaceae bacterium MAR_2010_72]
MNQQISINKAKFWTDERGILFCEFDNQDVYHKLDIDSVKIYEEAIISLTQGKSMPFLIDARNTRGSFTSKSAKLFAKSKIFKQARICEAFVVNSIKTELLINSFKRIYDPNTPFLVFNDIERALDYCLEAIQRYDEDN